MPSNLTEKKYVFNNGKYSAEIVFKGKAPDRWEFSHCKYDFSHPTYSLTEWQFLGELAKEIEELCRQEGVTL